MFRNFFESFIDAAHFFHEVHMKVYTYEKIYEIMTFMAKVVDRYGDTYLPIFERVQKELKKAEQRKTSLDLAKRIATKDTG